MAMISDLRNFSSRFPLSVYLSTQVTRPMMYVHVLFLPPRLPLDTDREM